MKQPPTLHQLRILAAVADSGGVTRAAAGDGAFSLNASIAMTSKDAQVQSYQMLVRSTMDYETAFKAMADVAPLGTDGKPSGDGTVNVFDALAILRHAVGLDPW